MSSFRLPGSVGVVCVLAATVLGCSGLDEDLAGGEPPVTTTADALVKQQENEQAGGFRATVSLISNFNGTGGWPDGRGTITVRLAACDGFNRLDGTPGAQLYVATATTTGTRRLYVTNDAAKDYGSGDPNVPAGTTWTQITSPGLALPATTQIGCDGHHLFAFNSATDNLYVAGTTTPTVDTQMRRGDGTFDAWNLLENNRFFADIQSGAGNLYVMGSTSPKPLYTQDSTTVGTRKTFGSVPADFVRVTGAGKASLATLASTPGNKMSGKNPPNRAFAIKTDGTLVYNDKVLSNPSSSTWTTLAFGSARFEDISASAPDVLWAITNTGGMRHLHLIRFTETNCTDGLDNDADGLTDGHDPECRVPLANFFCGGASNKVYCSSRFSSSQDFLVTCFNRALSGSPDMGRCVQKSSSENDTKIVTDIPEPAGTGRWCSAVYRPGTAWSVATELSGGVTNRDPCAAIVAQQPSGQTTEITGAGLFSRNGMNNVVGFCQSGIVGARRTNGPAALDDTIGFVRTQPSCKFLMSPADLPLFDLPYDKNAVSQLGATLGYGVVFDTVAHAAWDLMLPEGVPVLAVAAGRVVGTGTDPATGIVHGGSEDLQLSASARGDSHQSGIQIVHNVRSAATSRYRESFVSNYNHMRQRLVVPGQVVDKGQVIGYVGQMGQAWGGHIHFSVVRLSNTALSATDANTGSTIVTYDPWPIRGEVTATSSVSPFGWRNTSFDPWGTNFVTQGKGAFSPNLWNGTAQTPSPTPPITSLGW